MYLRVTERAGTGVTHLFFPEYDLVKEELQILVCIINAKLLKAVEGQILFLRHTHKHIQHTAGDYLRLILIFYSRSDKKKR